MNALLDALRIISDDPRSWGAVALLALIATVSLRKLVICPLVHGSVPMSYREAREAVGRPFFAGPRFLLLMLFGIVMTVTGLSFIARGINPVAAFYLILIGIFIMQTEPTRLQLREAELRVIAASCGPTADADGAIDRLRSSHYSLIAMNGVLLVGAAALLLAF